MPGGGGADRLERLENQRCPFLAFPSLLGLITIGSGIWDSASTTPDPGAMPVGGFSRGWPARDLSLSFYFSKSFLPVGLLPIYPKWTVDPPRRFNFCPGWFWAG
jgi:hypothetical protein